MRLETMFLAHARRNPGKDCLVFQNRRVSYGELAQAAHALAVGMHRWGIGCGDRVLLYVPNGVELVQAAYAAHMLGAVVVPVNVRLTHAELRHFLADSTPACVVSRADDRALLELVREHCPTAKLLLIGPGEHDQHADGTVSLTALSQPTDASLPPLPTEAEDAIILYTSGTTGMPKGAIITHANLIVQHAWINAVSWGITGNDRYLVTTSLAHRVGLARMTNALSLGGTVVIMDHFDAADAIDIIERESISVIGIVPTIARMLLPQIQAAPERLASLRHMIVTGEAFAVELKKQLVALLPKVQLHSFFASTEVGSVTDLAHEEQFTHPGSVGRPVPGVEVVLVDERNLPVPVGEVGEILVRSGPPGHFTTMRGYLGLPEATRETLVGGWVHTGDMGRLDPDGYLYIVDRKKDMVLSGGFNIYTKEVELAVADHPAVAEVAVIGIPDEVFGEAVVAFVQTIPGATTSEAELIEHCRRRIAGYKKPKHIIFVEALPRNATGKVLKSRLRDQLAQREGIHGAA